MLSNEINIDGIVEYALVDPVNHEDKRLGKKQNKIAVAIYFASMFYKHFDVRNWKT